VGDFAEGGEADAEEIGAGMNEGQSENSDWPFPFPNPSRNWAAGELIP
jgi:hypothetical protein